MERIIRASWRERFWAWLIDILLVSIFWMSLAYTLDQNWLNLVGLAWLCALLFIYWTALEGYRGQSLGKMVMNIVVIGFKGERIGFRDAAVQSLGKAFFLPLDCIIGWAVYRGEGLRAFNKWSETTVASIIEL